MKVRAWRVIAIVSSILAMALAGGASITGF